LRAELSFGVLDDEVDSYLKAFAALRQASPNLLIDGDDEALRTFEARLAPKGEPILIRNWSQSDRFRPALQAWKDKKTGKAARQGVLNPPAPN
jgi:hypothetical protein